MIRFFRESYQMKRSRPMSFLVNWFGLAIGFAAVIVMTLAIVADLRHDRDFTRPMDQVYRFEVSEMMQAITPSALQPALEQNPGIFPEIEAVTRAHHLRLTVGRVGESGARDNVKVRALAMDSAAYRVFPFQMVNGAFDLSNTAKVMLSRSVARRLFGTSNAAGQSLLVNNQFPLEVSGVFEQIGDKSHLQPEVLVNRLFMVELMGGNRRYAGAWNYWSEATFARLLPGTSPDSVALHIARHFFDYVPTDTLQTHDVVLRPFDELYFCTQVAGSGKAVDASKFRVLGLIAGLILVIAILNYINIYTARSVEVVRGMGIRAILGARRRQLIGFVIGDSILVAFLAAASGYVVAKGLEPMLPELLGTSVPMDLTWDLAGLVFVVLPLVCGLVSGIFPAWRLTRATPLDAMMNRTEGGRGISRVRQVLTVVQFTISMSLIAATIIINRQMNYMLEQDPGYNRENVVIVSGDQFILPRFEVFRSRLFENPNVVDATIIEGSPIYSSSIGTFYVGPDFDTQAFEPNVLYGDDHSFGVLGLRMLEGDSVGAGNVRQMSGKFVVNESFLEKALLLNPEMPFPGGYKDQYIGLMKNFRFRPLSDIAEIEPLIFGSIYGHGGMEGDAYIRINGHDLDATMQFIERTFREFWPDEVYDFSFMDALYNELYAGERLFRAQLTTFSLLAVFIGCLGLFALVGYQVERRRREIALRKVHGATLYRVIGMLCLGFLRWLGVSLVVAIPLTLWSMNGWLEGYPARLPIAWWIFALSGLLTLLVALLTVLGQSYRAATENPAAAMKTE